MSSIVVVGGGLAGLACAWRLRHAGHAVEVLECSDVAGGRLRTDEVDGYQIERGPSFFGPLDQNGRVLVNALGLAPSMSSLEPAGEGVLRRGRFLPIETESLRAFARSPLLSTGAKLRVARLALEIARQRGQLDLHHPELAGGLESDDAATDLAQLIGIEARDFAIGPLLESWLGAPLSATSDAFGRTVLHALVGPCAPQALASGMGAISEALASEVPIRFGARVHAVETEAGGARVRYRIGLRQRKVFADAVVVAVAGPRVAPLCPKLTPEERGYFEHTASARGIAVHVLLDEAPRALPFHRVHLPEVLGFEIAGIGLEHARRGAAPPGRGLLRVELSPAAVSASWGLDDGRLAACVLEQVERTPLGPLRVRHTRVHRDDHATALFGRGALQRLRSFVERRTRTPRVAFAGAHAIGPYTEGLLTSGLRAAADIVRGLPT